MDALLKNAASINFGAKELLNKKAGQKAVEKASETAKSLARLGDNLAANNRSEITSKNLGKSGSDLKEQLQRVKRYFGNPSFRSDINVLLNSDFDKLNIDSVKSVADMSATDVAKAIMKKDAQPTPAERLTVKRFVDACKSAYEHKDDKLWLAVNAPEMNKAKSEVKKMIKAQADKSKAFYADSLKYSKEVKAAIQNNSVELIDTAMTLIESGNVEAAQILIEQVLNETNSKPKVDNRSPYKKLLGAQFAQRMAESDKRYYRHLIDKYGPSETFENIAQNADNKIKAIGKEIESLNKNLSPREKILYNFEKGEHRG